jgi:Holliday junction resolvase RusA-like endonuclease
LGCKLCFATQQTANKIFIPGVPVAYVRTTQKQKFVDKQYHKYLDYKQYIGSLARQVINTPLEGPVMAEMTFYMPIPKNGKSKGKKVIEGDYHTSTKDLDNLVKGLLDSLNGIAFEDDKQVCEIHCKKIYSDYPGIEFEFISLT